MEALVVMAITQQVHATTATPDEMYQARRWVAAKFEGAQKTTPPEAGLVVSANYAEVCQNGRMGRPLTIGKTVYQRGLFCHAVSKVGVRLPSPGKLFAAIIGVDSNPQTHGGKGSIVFSISVAGTESFRSKVMHEGMPGQPVRVDLRGAKEFWLEVGNADDGIACDQADWADAKVTLEDGRVLWLGDLPIIEGQAPAEVTADPPFSFIYGGQPSAALLKTWDLKRSTKKLDDHRTARTLTYTDPKTGLVLRCEAIEYHDFPTVEWTLHFKNAGGADTPILKDIQALNTRFLRQTDEVYTRHGTSGEFTLNHHLGSQCSPSDYQPLRSVLGAKTEKRIVPSGGRPTNGNMPYFNIEWPAEGVIVVVGWPGQWVARFTRDGGNGLQVRAGQELTHFKLHPGEEVRTPLIVLQFWKGDRVRSQNIWRRWMMAHSMPRPGGKLPEPIALGSSYRVYHEMQNATEENQIMFINRYLAERLKIDYWWMDAGWYVNGHERGWPHVGTWEVDKKRFPKGFKPISDHAHAHGIKILVWFEPERVAADTWLTQNHPEWVLGGAKGGLLNLGNPEARTWLTDHVDTLLTEQGIDLYRQDFNMDPLGHWRGNDAKDRQGMTEIRHVTGYLAYWDELIRRHPSMLIDTCASGGRRNDLETLRRAVPLWRSDYGYEPVGNQCQTYSLSLWVPFHGAGNAASSSGYYGAGPTVIDLYAFWSTCYPSNNFPFDMRAKENDYEALRKLFAQRRAVVANFYGDFYPLTPYSQADDAWLAWQFNRPEAGEGMVQAFRRPESDFVAARFRLRGLDPEARYAVGEPNTTDTSEVTGRELMEDGVYVAMKTRPGAAVVCYKRR